MALRCDDLIAARRRGVVELAIEQSVAWNAGILSIGAFLGGLLRSAIGLLVSTASESLALVQPSVGSSRCRFGSYTLSRTSPRRRQCAAIPWSARTKRIEMTAIPLNDGWGAYPLLRLPQGGWTMSNDVQDFFSRHAAGYTASQSHRSGQDLALLTELLQPQPTDRLIDIAAGTGHTALHLRPLIAQAVLVDFTPEMLAEAKKLAEHRGLDIATVVADAVAVPLPDASFTLATCRRAAHHFTDIPGFLAEARRLLASGGRLAISDMTADDAVIDLVNRIERLRDSSHRSALSPRGWRAAVEAAGFAVQALEIEREDYALLRWLAPVSPEEVDMQAIQEILRSANSNEREALGIREEVDGLHFVKSRTVLVAVRT